MYFSMIGCDIIVWEQQLNLSITVRIKYTSEYILARHCSIYAADEDQSVWLMGKFSETQLQTERMLSEMYLFWVLLFLTLANTETYQFWIGQA